jgi:TRAP-type C4-dicarboxylate transport system substrate-binding protein
MKRNYLPKRRGHILPVVGCLAAVIVVAGAQLAFAQQKAEPITLNWAAFVSASHPEMIGFNKGFISKAIELSKGRLGFKFRGGPETFATMDLPKVTQSGIIDFSINLAGIAETICPGVGATFLSRISVDEERRNGTYAYMEQLSNRGGLHYMGRHTLADDLQFFHLFLNKKVEKPEDFKKLKIGTAVACRAATEAWGAAVVNLRMTDYYTAMERNTVDGITSPPTNWVNSGCQAVTKYMAQPGFFTSSLIVVMNLSRWNKLPPDLQEVINKAMIYSEKLNGELYTEDKAKSMGKLKEANVEVYNLPPDTAKWFVDTAYKATWAYQMKRFPKETPRLKQLLSGGK